MDDKSNTKYNIASIISHILPEIKNTDSASDFCINYFMSNSKIWENKGVDYIEATENGDIIALNKAGVKCLNEFNNILDVLQDYFTVKESELNTVKYENLLKRNIDLIEGINSVESIHLDESTNSLLMQNSYSSAPNFKSVFGNTDEFIVGKRGYSANLKNEEKFVHN